MPDDGTPVGVQAGIGTDRGPRVAALLAAGSTVFPVNPPQQAAALQGQAEESFGQHPDAGIYLSQPGIGVITGARVPGEPGDDKNYAGTSPITRASGNKKFAAARYVHNDRLIDALTDQAFSALRASPGARAF